MLTARIVPVQPLVTGFSPDAKFEGRIMEELSSLDRRETIGILDLLFVRKDAGTGDRRWGIGSELYRRLGPTASPAGERESKEPEPWT